MEKAGGMFKSSKLQEKGAERRADAGGYGGSSDTYGSGGDSYGSGNQGSGNY